MHSQQQYLWLVLYYKFQLNQNWIIYLIPYIVQSLYFHLSRFFLEWIYLSVLRHAQGVHNNPVIKGGCTPNRPSMAAHSIEFPRPHCHSLDDPEIASEEEQNIWSHDCIRKALLTFVLLMNSLSNTVVASYILFLLTCNLWTIQAMKMWSRKFNNVRCHR